MCEKLFTEKKLKLFPGQTYSHNKKLAYECICGNTTSITYQNLIVNKVGCEKCSTIKRKVVYQDVFDYFESKDCQLITTETEYNSVSSNKLLVYTCSCKAERQTISWKQFRKGVRCKKCLPDRRCGGSGYKKIYRLPTGVEIIIEGYEPYAFDELIELMGIPVSDLGYASDCPVVLYKFDDVIRRYYPDIYIAKLNMIIEVKSQFTYLKHFRKNNAKYEYVKAQGYNMIVWIYDENGYKIDSKCMVNDLEYEGFGVDNIGSKFTMKNVVRMADKKTYVPNEYILNIRLCEYRKLKKMVEDMTFVMITTEKEYTSVSHAPVTINIGGDIRKFNGKNLCIDFIKKYNKPKNPRKHQDRYSYNDVVKMFDKRYMVLLTPRDKIRGMYQDNGGFIFEYICKLCNNNKTISGANFMGRITNGCVECHYKTRRLGEKEITKVYVDNNCTLLTPYDQYKNNIRPVEFICNVCNTKGTGSFLSFRYNGIRCQSVTCLKENNSL